MSETFRARLEKRVANAAMRLPRSWMVKLAGGSRVQIDDFVLDEQVQLAIAMAAHLGKKLTHELDVAAARRELETSAAVFAPRVRPMARVEDRKIPGPAGSIPIRIYVPRRLERPAPALVFFHGGGFCLGSLDSHDAPCRVIADDARCIVVSVDYRLAPEHPFPAGVDDAIAAFRWVAKDGERLGIDPARVAVGGDSAGGNLAAVVSNETRTDEKKPCLQLLIYPTTDATLSHPSIRSLGKGFFLEYDSLVWFTNHYLGDHDRRDPRASPFFTPDLRAAPPAFVATAGFDPLRDEGQAYADRLRDAGVRVRYRCYSSLFHGFFSASGGFENARPALVEAAAALRESFRA